MSATKTKNTAPDIDTLLATVEQIERALPPDAGEIHQRRTHLEGEIRVAKENIRDLDKQRSSGRAQAEMQRLKQSLADRQEQLESMQTFSPQLRRDAVIELLKHLPRLRELNTEVSESWRRLTEFKLKGALSSAEYVELERLEKLRGRINQLTRKATTINSELADLVPDHIDIERKTLQATIKALADIPSAGTAGNAAATVRAWASEQLSRLTEAVKSMKWAELESFQVAPM
ncbi:MAG TPA: hypothetical protein PKL76_20960 [Phycisphaerae bacterium]|nr:hypothetical protein [Phycisphaerae bacterium]